MLVGFGNSWNCQPLADLRILLLLLLGAVIVESLFCSDSSEEVSRQIHGLTCI